MPADQAVLADRAAPGLPLGGEGGHLGHQPPGRAQAARGHHQPLEPEPLVGEAHAVALGPDQAARRDQDVLEGHDRVVVADRVRVGRGAHHPDAGAGQVHDEHGVLTVVRAASQPGLEERVVGGIERGHVPLDPVQAVAVAVPVGGGLDGRHVGPGALLGDRVALLALTLDGRAHVAVELGRGGHRREPGRRRGRHPAERVGHPAHLLLDQDLLERGAATPAQLGRHVGGVQAQFAGPLGLGRGHVRGQVTAGQFGLLLERDQLVGEGRGPGPGGRDLRWTGRTSALLQHPWA